MKRTSRKPSELSESLHRQLSSYALSASAAGVGMLALVQPAEAKIVYTVTNRQIIWSHTFYLDLNHAGTRDFKFRLFYGSGRSGSRGQRLRVSSTSNGSGVVGTKDDASALSSGIKIGPKSKFPGGWLLMIQNTCSQTNSKTEFCYTWGPWKNLGIHYLGLKLLIHGKAHYGWARLDVTVPNHSISAVLIGYAYETIPGKSIIAGKTHGPDVITLEPASLGHLAQGASAIEAWRESK
jgi:hypothetical protein